MKTFRLYIFFPLMAVLCTGCSSEESNNISEQQTKIESYLESYDNGSNVIETEGIYIYVAESEFAPGRVQNIQKGDVVHFYIAGYQFQNRREEPTFYTNFPYLLEELRESGLNTIYMPQGQEVVTIGDNKLIKGIEIGLQECTGRDSVSIFLTSDKAYGANYVSNLPQNSAVEYVIKIEEIERAE